MVERRPWQSEADLLGRADAAHPTAWFEQLWASAASGTVTTPWEHDDPHPALAERVVAPPDGEHRTAVVVGCGLGADAEHLSRLGYVTTAFDVAPSAVAAARDRRPGSAVTYAVGDLLDLPAAWRRAFDLVVEVFTVQAVHRVVRAELTAGVRSLVAPGGTLLVIQAVADKPDDDGPPWPLTRAEIDAFGQDGLVAVSVERLDQSAPGGRGLWRAELRRADQ